ncbi:hypothetical protein H6P81_016861 [Aristolochia fimbriata]|uniref:Uncharacterized protein n=1 Tax=Aristolochia fimbriata TaxID=158543 RepID=A0AAV7DWQ5_ARIFI|nr:hypothetical protein H6P81_016861 [Aristolochia fimbriata]
MGAVTNSWGKTKRTECMAWLAEVMQNISQLGKSPELGRETDAQGVRTIPCDGHASVHGRPQHSYISLEKVFAVDWSPDGEKVASGGKDRYNNMPHSLPCMCDCYCGAYRFSRLFIPLDARSSSLTLDEIIQRFHSICCGLDDGKTSKQQAGLTPHKPQAGTAAFQLASFLARKGTVIVKRLEDLAKEGESPVDSFPWFDPSQKNAGRVRMMIAFTPKRGPPSKPKSSSMTDGA